MKPIKWGNLRKRELRPRTNSIHSRGSALDALRYAAINKYAWPGRYDVGLILSDGEIICSECARSEYEQLYRATITGDLSGGWAVECTEVLEELSQCCNCGNWKGNE